MAMRALAAIAAALVALAALARPAAAAPAQNPYAGQQIRPIKALSAADIAGLRDADGMGMARAAELNGYPGPLHVLQLATDLGLTAQQIAEAKRLRAEVSAAARPLGAELIDRERALDQLFAGGAATPEQIAGITAAIGTLKGRLRAVHLTAHLAMRAALNPGQLANYNALRGYGESATPDRDHPHHHAGGHHP